MTVPPWQGPIGWPPGLASKKLGVMEYLNSSAKAVVETRARAASNSWGMRRMMKINRLCFSGTWSDIRPGNTDCNGKENGIAAQPMQGTDTRQLARRGCRSKLRRGRLSNGV